MNKIARSLAMFGIAVLTASASADPLNEAILDLQTAWAQANYQMPEAQLEPVFEGLTRRARAVVEHFPGRAEPLVWEAIIISSDAGKNGGLGALGKVKQARKLLLEAEKIDAGVLDGSIYTSLGSLYYQVPGWPIGFGDDEQAERYLRKALELNPHGIDANYFYGDFLLRQKRYREAVEYLAHALGAPPRPGRPVADAGRRQEAGSRLAIAREKAESQTATASGSGSWN